MLKSTSGLQAGHLYIYIFKDDHAALQRKDSVGRTFQLYSFFCFPIMSGEETGFICPTSPKPSTEWGSGSERVQF